jgi:hypothetical protein
VDRRTLLRDAALAVLALSGLLGWLRRTGNAGALGSPATATIGAGGALTVERVLLARPRLTRRLWGRRTIRAGATLGTVGAGGLLGPRSVAALCWGLVTYLGLVVWVLVTGKNPLAPRSGPDT